MNQDIEFDNVDQDTLSTMLQTTLEPEKEAVKQYVVHYSSNDYATAIREVTIYINGTKFVTLNLTRDEYASMIALLEYEGYTKAYDLDELRKSVETAEIKLEIAKRAYNLASSNALIKAK